MHGSGVTLELLLKCHLTDMVSAHWTEVL